MTATLDYRPATVDQVLAEPTPKHAIAEAVLRFRDQPLSLQRYKLMWPMYDLEAPKIIYKTGRGVTKSTTLSNIMVLNARFRNFYKSLYVAPLASQTMKFSNLYVKPTIRGSPLINNFSDSASNGSVLLKTFKNNSAILFNYIANGVDRIRGTHVDEVNWDEVQDMPWDHLPEVEQVLSASRWHIQRYCGTPKTLDNTIEYLWMMSSQNEWLVRCIHCNKECACVLPQAFDMVGPDGPRCYHCQRLLDVEIGRWEITNPGRTTAFLGLHVPQIFVSHNLTRARWDDIYQNFLTYPRAKFANEVLGLSFDMGGRLINLTELRALKVLVNDDVKKPNTYAKIVAGIDWGIAAISSFTVLTIIGITGAGKFHLIYAKKFLHTDIVAQVEEIAKTLAEYRVDMAGADFGVGYTNNQLLRKLWCPQNLHKLAEYQYCSSRSLLIWNKKISRYLLNKTNSLNILFLDFKQQHVLFPNSPISDEIFADVLSEYEEVVESTSGVNKVFRRNPAQPDDYLHAINFACITSKRLIGKLLVDYKDDEPKD